MWDSQTVCNHKGISLVEVVIVLVIISILAFMTGPDLLAIGPRAKMKTAARDLKSNLELARMEAAKRNRSVYVIFTPGNCSGDYNSSGSYEIVIDADINGVDTDGKKDSRLTLAQKEKKYQLKPGTALCATDLLLEEKKQIRFNGSGFSVDSKGKFVKQKIKISSRYKQGNTHPVYTVTVTAIGQISIDS